MGTIIVFKKEFHLVLCARKRARVPLKRKPAVANIDKNSKLADKVKDALQVGVTLQLFDIPKPNVIKKLPTVTIMEKIAYII